MYCGVRYPVMRCYIGRLAIQHSYGWLHAGMGILPSRTRYEQAWLAVQPISGLSAKGKRRPAKKQDMPLDMEIIIGCKDNRVFPPWLEYIKMYIAAQY